MELITNSVSGVRDKHQENQQWAISSLRKTVPFYKWIRIKERSDFETELYLDILDILFKVATGNMKLYDTISITSKNGVQHLEID